MAAVAFLPHAIVRRPSTVLGEDESGTWVALSREEYHALRLHGTLPRVLFLTLGRYAAAMRGLTAAEESEVVHAALEESLPWSTCAHAIAYAGERRRLFALLESDAGADAVDETLQSMAVFRGWNYLEQMRLDDAVYAGVEWAWRTILVTRTLRELARDAGLGAVLAFAGEAERALRPAALALQHAHAALEGREPNDLPYYVSIARRTLVAPFDDRVQTWVQIHALDWFLYDDAVVVDADDGQLSDLDWTRYAIRPLFDELDRTDDPLEPITVAQRRELVTAALLSPNPPAVRLLGSVVAELADFCASWIVIARRVPLHTHWAAPTALLRQARLVLRSLAAPGSMCGMTEADALEDLRWLAVLTRDEGMAGREVIDRLLVRREPER